MAAAYADADAADVLLDNMLLVKIPELINALGHFKLIRAFFDGCSGAGLNAQTAGAAVVLDGLIGFKRHVGKDGHQAELAAQLFINQEIIPSDPTQAR